MGKWTDRLKTLNAPVTLPAEPAEGATGGNGGLLAGVPWHPEQMSLSQFGMSGQYRKVHSKVLDETILLAADNAELPDFNDIVVYRASEARVLVGLSAEEVRAFHEVKVYFEGIIERAAPNESHIDAADLLGGRGGQDELTG